MESKDSSETTSELVGLSDDKVTDLYYTYLEDVKSEESQETEPKAR